MIVDQNGLGNNSFIYQQFMRSSGMSWDMGLVFVINNTATIPTYSADPSPFRKRLRDQEFLCQPGLRENAGRVSIIRN